MPGTFSHFLILDAVRQRLHEDVRQDIDGAEPYAYWGSVGPDFLFFAPQDWNGKAPIGEIGEFLLDVEDKIAEIKGTFNALSDAFHSVGDYLSGGLKGDIERLATSAHTTINAYFQTLIVNEVDFYSIIKPPIGDQENYGPEVTKWPQWWLIDLTHHVRTTDLLKNMYANARGDAELRSYCAGYATHVGADVVGHAYVNNVVGGPYRTQWRRHALVEKAIDQILWSNSSRPPLTASHAHRLIAFDSTSFPAELPRKLSELITAGLKATYPNTGQFPKMPEVDEIDHSYRMFYRYIKGSTTHSALNLPKPPDFDWFDLPEDLANRIDDWSSRRPSFGNAIGGGGSLLKKIKRALRAIAAFVAWAMEIVMMVALLPVYVVMRLATTPLRYLLWLAMQALYEVYDKFRLILALAAYVHPEVHQVRDVTAFMSFDCWPSNLTYPFSLYNDNRFIGNREQTYHLQIPPFGAEERAATTSIPCCDELANISHWFLGSREHRNGLWDVCTTDRFWQRELSCEDIPTCVDLSVQVIEQLYHGGDIPNWNLDADRGFGWPCWEVQHGPDWQIPGDFKWNC